MVENISFVCRNPLDWLRNSDELAQGHDYAYYPEGMFTLSLAIKILDDLLIFGGVIGIILTAIVYGAWTKWGFFKQHWLTVKWILTIVMVLIGWIIMGPAVKGNVHEIDWYMVNQDVYNRNLAVSAIWGPIQLLLLAVVVIISVFKPWKTKGKQA